MDDTEKKKQVNLFQKKYIKAFFISLLIVIFQQFSGINALLTNLTVIFENSNINLNPSVSSVIVTSAQVITVACSTPLVEFLGRRATWWISSLGQGVFLLILWANEEWNWSKIVPVVMLFFDVLFFGIGLGPLPWFVVPELFPDEVRGLAMGIIQAVNWFFAALMIFVFPTMQDTMTLAWVYFFYGVIMIISFLYGLFFLPETRGEEMGALVNQKDQKEKEKHKIENGNDEENKTEKEENYQD